MGRDKCGEWIPFNRPFLAGKELEYIRQAVENNMQLSGDGPFSRRCQEWLEQRLGCRKVLLTHSCTAALEMAALLCELQPGDEVSMPSFTFVSTANAFALRGAVPVFVDIRRDTLNLDEAQVESAITPMTRSLAPMHYAGWACEMDRLLELAARHHLFVIEDAAQSLLSTYKTRFLGTLGDLGCLSFHETKNIISGEGGALLINHPRLVERAEILREKGTNRTQFKQGLVDKYTWVDLGSSYLPSDMIGAFLYAQLEQADAIIAKRRSIYEAYCRGLQSLEQEGRIQLPRRPDAQGENNGHLFYILTRSFDERKRLIEFLAERGIHAVFHYIPLHSSPAGKRLGRSHGNLAVTEEVADRLLRLPLFYEMTEAQVERVVQALFVFYRS